MSLQTLTKENEGSHIGNGKAAVKNPNEIVKRRPALTEIGNKVNGPAQQKVISKSILKTTKCDVPGKQREDKKVLIPIKKQIEKPNQIQNETKCNVKAYSRSLVVEDIDKADGSSCIMLPMYTTEIHNYMRELEKKFAVKESYLSGSHLTSKMRSVLIDWLVDVHTQFVLLQETLYLTVAVLDRYLQDKHSETEKKKLQLVGVGAMFVACKYEETQIPELNDFLYITDNSYSKDEIIQMELSLVLTLDFNFGCPLPLHFLRRYSKAANATPVIHTMAKFILELSIIEYELCHIVPSVRAAAAISLAMWLSSGNMYHAKPSTLWTPTLVHYSTYTFKSFSPVFSKLASIVVAAEKSKFQAVRRKYSSVKYHKVSLRHELKHPELLKLVE